jgi:hypothetical protein
MTGDPNTDIARRRINIWKNHNKLQKIAGLETCDYYTFKRYVFNNELSQVAILIRAAEMVQVIRKKGMQNVYRTPTTDCRVRY